MPEDMVAVTKEEFFAALRADKRDIMPSVRERCFTTWETTRREAWGWSAPGWANTGEHEPVFAIRRAVA